MEVKIQIPDNCELIKDGDTYVVREKKQGPPRSWEEFCENYPIQKGESHISLDSVILAFTGEVFRDAELDKDVCTSEEEAAAFLALMQLRQLRKAWVGDWKQTKGNKIAGIFYSVSEDKITVSYDKFWTNIALSFPTEEMASDFLNCFRDLCETAKILL